MQNMPQDRSIRNIPVSSEHKIVPQGNNIPPPHDYDDNENNENNVLPPRRQKLPQRRSNRIWWLMGSTVVVCAVAGLLLSTVFEGAMVTITPKIVVITTAQTLTALPNAKVDTLAYQTITASQTATTTVIANGTQQVTHNAVGVVTFSNTFSAAPQKLTANTRIATPDGKMYKIKDAVTVPGMLKKSDGSISAGTISVSIIADKPGAEYNQKDPVQLSIVGFKGSTRYTKFSALSQGSISGGIVGDEPAVSPSDMSNAQNELKRLLDSNIRSTATSQIPGGFIAVNGSLGVSYTDISKIPGSGNSLIFSQGATATVAIVRISDLANALAKHAVADYKGEHISFGDMTKTTITLANNGGSNITGPLNLTIGGNPSLVWQFDKDAFKRALLGKNKTQFHDVVRSFEPAVAKAEASIRPFWKATFPTNPTKLTVTISQ